MSERLKDWLRNTASAIGRNSADRTNSSCLAASILEMGAELGTGNPTFDVIKFGRVIGETEKGTTPPGQLLYVIQQGVGLLDMQISRITVNPSFLEHCDIPSGMESLLREATGVQQVKRPHLRIMAKQVEDFWYTHAETDTDSSKSRQRIGRREEDGWISAMIVEVAKG